MCFVRVGLHRPDALRGGNCNNDLKVGAFYCNLNNHASNSNWNIGAAESYLKLGNQIPCGMVLMPQGWDPILARAKMNLMQASSGRFRRAERG